jgi:hypothetical protein
MKLRNANRQLRRLQRSVKELDLDLQAILEEHDRYRLRGSDESILNWFESLPIETLCESLDHDHHRPRTRYSLQDMRHKFALRRLHEKKTAELVQKQSELKVAKIDCVLAEIERIQNGEDTRRNPRGKKSSR